MLFTSVFAHEEEFIPISDEGLILPQTAEIKPTTAATTDEQMPAMPQEQGYPLKAPYEMGYSLPARIDVQGSWDLYLVTNFIYWQPKQQNMSYSQLTYSSYANDRAEDFDLSYHYQPGLQVGLGTNLPHDDWNLFFQYTWLNVNHSEAKGIANGNTLVNFWLAASNANAASTSRVTAHWRLSTHLMDLVITRPYYQGKYVIIKPYAGLRSALLDQKYHLKYTISGYEIPSFFKQDTWAIGPRLGLDSSCLLGCGFAINAGAAYNLLYQHFTVNETQANSGNPSILFIKIRKGLSQLTSNPQAYLALGWGSYFDEQYWHFHLDLRYDFQVFFDQNQMKSLLSSTSNPQVADKVGNLFYQGLTVSVRFDF